MYIDYNKRIVIIALYLNRYKYKFILFKYLLVYNLGNSTTLVDDICGEYEKKGYKTVFVGFGHNTFFMTEKQKNWQ